jgi:small ligand-binding sensory domain FIST
VYGVDARATVLDEDAPTSIVLDDRSPFVLDGAVHLGAGVAAGVEGCRVEVEVVPDCRPVGEPFAVTSVEGTMVRELGGRPALERVRSILDDLEGDERRLAKHGLHLGVVIDESKARFRPRDFAVVDLLGGDPATQVIAVGTEVQLGATVQLVVRDEEVEDRHLRELLGSAAGALLFTNGGREGGRELPGTPVAGMTRAGRTSPTAVLFRP